MPLTKRGRIAAKSRRATYASKKKQNRYIRRVARTALETRRRYFPYGPEEVKTTDLFKIYSQDAKRLTQDNTLDGMSGHKIMATGLKSLFQVRNNGTAPVTVMFKLVWVKHGNVQGIGTYDNILEDNSGNGAPTGTLLELYRSFDKEIFKTLYTKYITLGTEDQANLSGKPMTAIVRHWKKIKNAVYTFNGSNLTPTTGFLAWYVMVRAPDGTQADEKKVELTSHHTFFYKDM